MNWQQMSGLCHFCHSRCGPESSYRWVDFSEQQGDMTISSNGITDNQATSLQLANGLEREQLKQLEILSIIEATTLVLLACVAVPLKHAFGWPLGSLVLGPIHGIAFLAYGWTALQTVAGGGWRGSDMARLFIVAFLPFAGFFNISWLRRRAGSLNGEHIK